jgi:hypothetical protein
MEIAQIYLFKFQDEKQKLRCERDELVRNFLGHDIRIRDRKTGELKLATAADIAIKLRYVPTQDLYAFHKLCLGARCYSKYFHWALKPQKV